MATVTVTPGYSWSSGEIVTPAKMNLAAAPTVAVALADGEVTNAKLATGIDASKLTTGTLPIARIADGAVVPAKLSQPYTLATAQASTSGAFIDFTAIPSWAKRITVMLDSVSFAGTANMLIQIGSGSLATSGYASWSTFLQGTTTTAGAISSSAGFVVLMAAATNIVTGTFVLNLVGYNTWLGQGIGVYSNNGSQMFAAGKVALSGSLDRVRITRSDASDTFDAGAISISYEG
jgi:hypothetical protein